ncbi:hypothetical protein H0H93_011131 [Arthromyces matolae]|nr:hypothetical protein H0H93_011131 [Arthromyces matolae]
MLKNKLAWQFSTKSQLATIPTLEMITLLPNILIPYFEVTNNMLDRLMIQAIRSGSITAVAALVELILFVIQPSNYIHVTFLFFMSKLSGFIYEIPENP